MHRPIARPSLALAGLALAALLLGCDRKTAPEQPAKPADAAVQLGPENVVAATRQKLRSGPQIAGALRARKEATVRAEVGGQLLENRAEAGLRVKRGDLVARIQDAAVSDQLAAAESAARAAANAVETSEKNFARARKLAEAEAIAPRDLEQAETALAGARAQLADARARVATGEQMLARLRLRAPFDGVVAERHASAGDIVQPGTPLFTVVDPSSLRLEAFVPADFVGRFQRGTPVDFDVTGFAGRTFQGRIEQVSPSVDASTGQVKILVELPNVEGKLLAGLFARGRIANEARDALAVPLEAVDLATTPPTVVRVRDGRAERVQVELGLRDEVAEAIEVRSGLAEGDVVLRASARGGVGEGTAVKLPAAKPAAG
jgi:RND family efflux transporter MFP subunit